MKDARRWLVLAASLVAVAVAAGCGDDEGSSNGGSATDDPAITILEDAGLDVCSESQSTVPGGLSSEPGPTASRGFYVASACGDRETTENAVVVFQFSSRAAAEEFESNVASEFPDGQVASEGPLIVVTTGPDAEGNLEAISAQLPTPTDTAAG